MTLNGTLNNYTPSNWLVKDDCVRYVPATTRTSTITFGTTLYTSVYHINANLVRSEYTRPLIQWRLRMAFSSGNTNSIYSYGFFKVSYDQHFNVFSQSIEQPNSADFTLTTDSDNTGWTRVVITIVSQNTPTHINVNIA